MVVFMGILNREGAGMNDKIQKIINEFQNLYIAMNKRGLDIEGAFLLGTYIGKLKNELSKTKKLHEIFKQNEPNKDTETLKKIYARCDEFYNGGLSADEAMDYINDIRFK